jgi:predicted permease
LALPLSIDFIRRIRLPALLTVAYLSVGSVVEVLVAAWPTHVHDVNWRLSVLNSAAGATGTELMALLILVVIAQLSMSVAGLWTAFWASTAVALGYLAAAGMFGLDSLQLRARIPADQLHRFDVTVVWALARFGIVELVCLALAACALTAARSLRREMAGDTSNRLIVGTSALALAPAHPDGLARRRGTTPSYGESVGS